MKKVEVVALKFVDKGNKFEPVFYFSNGDSLGGKKAWGLYKTNRLETYYRNRYMKEYPADISFTAADFKTDNQDLHDTLSVGRMM